MSYDTVRDVDPAVADALEGERTRQNETLAMIASENHVSTAVLEAQSSELTNKYAEGYPGERYYGGCTYADKIEELAIERAKELWGAEHVNVQPHSGTQANMGVYLAMLDAGDKILSLELEHGGHLSHGHPANFTGKTYEVDSTRSTRRPDTSIMTVLPKKQLASNQILSSPATLPIHEISTGKQSRTWPTMSVPITSQISHTSQALSRLAFTHRQSALQTS